MKSDYELLKFIASIGCMMIKNGAEIQRTEKTMLRIAAADGIHSAEVFTQPTSVIVTLYNNTGEVFTELKRPYTRRINLEKVIACDTLALDYITHKKSIHECMETLDYIDSLTDFKPYIRVLSYSIICMAFTILFRATVKDGIIAFVVGTFQGIAIEIFSKYNLSGFLSNVFASALVAFMAYTFYHLGITTNYNTIILGSIMPLVPGFAVTNVARDLLYGDYVAGGTRLTEAIIMSIGITTGIITISWLFKILTGV